MIFPLRSRRKAEVEFQREILVHLDSMYSTALRLCRDAGDADDVVQETCLRAWRSFHQYTPGTNAKAWAFRILMNTFINRYRSGRREQDRIASLDLADALDRLPPPPDAQRWSDPEVAFFDRDVSPVVLEAIESLSEEFRTVLLLADWEDLTYQEIADIMGTPIGTVMSRLYRARRAMQARLYEYAVEQGHIPRSEADGGGPVSLDEFRRRRSESEA